MSKVYKITPLHKKSIYYVAEMYRHNKDGTTSWFTVEDHYRWGQGFIEEDLSCNLPYIEDTDVYCDPNAGWGAELDDQVACSFDFSEDIPEEEQQQIEEAFEQGGLSWLHDGEHDWQLEDDNIVVLAPFKVELCEDDGTVISEVQLESRPDPKTTWPFSKDFPKPE